MNALAHLRFDINFLVFEFLMRPWLLSFLVALGLSTAVPPARAEVLTYSYSVVHPLYGTIGTFTEGITASGNTTRIDSQVRVAVRILGIVIYREEGNHTEIFLGDRLVSLQSTTITNGTRLDVRGESQGDRFVVTTPAGVVEAPADVAPSDPWLLRNRGIGMVVSIKTGRVFSTRVTGGEPAMVSLQGVMIATHHFMAQGERQQETWLNDRDVPIVFRSVENGTPINFYLISPWHDAAVAEADMVPAAKVQPEGER